MKSCRFEKYVVNGNAEEWIRMKWCCSLQSLDVDVLSIFESPTPLTECQIDTDIGFLYLQRAASWHWFGTRPAGSLSRPSPVWSSPVFLSSTGFSFSQLYLMMSRGHAAGLHRDLTACVPFTLQLQGFKQKTLPSGSSQVISTMFSSNFVKTPTIK